MRTKIFFLFSFFLFLVLSCSNPFANQQLSMIADPGVTEAWLSLHVDGVRSGAEYILQRDGTTIFKGRLQSPDTVVYDSLLTPATTYTYRFYARENGEDSPALQSSLTTMDTTSHNFSWQSYEFGGQKGSSSFYDVAIIDENDIWAVGEIYTEDTYTYDSLGNFIQPYNAAHWDGEKWELKRIKTAACGGVVYPTLETVFSFGKDDIVFSDGAMLIHFDGDTFKSDCSLIPKLTGGVRKIWGTSYKDYYVVGTNGLISHYNGTSWIKIESGTDLPIQDIWGNFNRQTNAYDIYAIASEPFKKYDTALIAISNLKAEKLNIENPLSFYSSIWFPEQGPYYISGSGVYKNKTIKNKKWYRYPDGKVTNYYTHKIRGTARNNVFACGAFGEIVHYNGAHWYNFLNEMPSHGRYIALDVKGKLVAVAGEGANAAVCLIGKSY